MNIHEIEQVRKRAAERVNQICNSYGLYGTVVHYTPSPIQNSTLNRLYVIAGYDPAICREPLPKYIRPDEIIRRNNRNEKLFYSGIWAFDLYAGENEMEANHALVEYCKTAEFLSTIYSEHGMDPPQKIRVSEIGQLINFRKGLDNPLADRGLIQEYKKGLDWFFRREKTTNAFRKQWLDYFRSDKFPDDAGPVQKLFGFFRRNRNIINVDHMMEVNSDICKLQMQEHEYKLFEQLIKECYPEVVYAVGDLEIVDHGSINYTKSHNSPFGRCVSGEEYAAIRNNRFASEGFEALSDLRMTYWEFRDVYYRAVDEPLIAAAYNKIILNYANCNSISELKELGPICLQKIPASDFMNFVSLAKANNFRFYIDNRGDYERPSLDTIHVIYNEFQEDKLRGIRSRMINDKIEHSHMFDGISHPSLSSVLESIDEPSLFSNETNGNSCRSHTER